MGTVRTISTRLAIEGESQYKQSIASCNSELSVLKSSLALVESQFKGNANSMEALAAKGSTLSELYEKQKEKVETLENALENAKNAQESYAERVGTAKEKVAEYEKALNDLENATGDTSEEQAALTAELDKWNAELKEAEAYQVAAERGVNNWQKQLNNSNIELNKLSGEIEKNNKYLSEAEKSADGCAKSIDEFGKETDKSANAIENLAGALAAAGIAKTVKEIADTLTECADAAAGFETALAKLSTLADTSVVPMETLKLELLSLSEETGVAVESLTEAAYQALSASVDTADVISFVATATKLSAAGFTEASTAVDVMTTALNAYGMQGSEAEKVASMLVKTQDLGKTSVDELAQSMGRVIPSAAAYGVEIDNLSAAYAILTKNGQNTRIATTNLGAMLDELASTSSNVAGILKEQTGKSLSDLTAEGSNLGDVINVLSDSVNGNSTAFANLWSSTTAMKSALTLFNEGGEEFNSILHDMQNSSGMVERNFKIMADTTEFAEQRMLNALENLKIAIGTELNPTIESVYQKGANAFTWATDFVEENPGVVKAISILVVGLGTLTATVTAATVAMAAFKAIQALVNPATLIAGAVAGVVTALGALVISLGSADAETKAFKKSLEESKKAHDELTESMAAEQKSTQGVKDALTELLEVENKSAAQKEAILGMVDQLNEAVPELGLAYNAVTDSINMTAESVDNLIEKAAAQEEYEAQVARLTELYAEQAEANTRLTEAQEALAEAQEAGAGGTRKLQNNVDDLTAASGALAAEIAELEEASREYGERQAEIAAKTSEMEGRVTSLIAEIAALQASYEEAYVTAYDSIGKQLGLFTALDGTAKTSIKSLISTLDSQIEYMNTYAENIQKAMEIGVDQGLVQKLSDGSEKSAQILAAIVRGGEEDITALNEKLAKIEEGKENFAEVVAEMETDFSEKMAAIVSELDAAIAEMDVADYAYVIGSDNIQGLIDGAASKKGALIKTYTDLANAALSAYKEVMAQMSPSKKMYEAGSFDFEGLIRGAKSKEVELKETYGSMARAALDSVERARPSRIDEPSTAEQQNRQTAEIVQALSANKDKRGDTYVNITAPDPMDERTVAQEFKKAQRDLSLDVS